jgi:PKHD-type hydroxylase
MNKSAEFFDQNGYVVVTDVLPKQTCEELTQHMFSLLNDGKLTKDDQCPISDAIYGDPVFDDLLQKFAEPVGNQVGRKLLPTYTYARIYRPGEVLKKHKDRPACEISCTLTLGYNGKSVWPIFFDENKAIPVMLEPGEMAVYKGCDIAHWRTEFKGDWHVQVFFHYVDANGPYKDEYKDRRPDFGIDKKTLTTNAGQVQTDVTEQEKMLQQVKYNKPVFGGVIISSQDDSFPGYTSIDSSNYRGLMFTKEECTKITNLVKDNYPAPASIGGNQNNSKVAESIRSADIYILENDDENRWLFDKVSTIVTLANKLHFDYDISGIIHGIQLIHYKSNTEVAGHYDWHIDSGPGISATRKISFTAQISPPEDYEGCELILNNNGQIVTATKEQGSVHLFPSYMSHRVTPVTKGERFALVIWIHGSRRFR